MASLVTAPLERQFGQIPSLSTMTSSSSFGISQITLQFDLNRDIDRRRAGRAVRHQRGRLDAAAQPALPADLRQGEPRRRADHDAGADLDHDLVRQLSDLADTLLAQRLSELTGVGQVSVAGRLAPAIRIQADLARLASYGIALEDLRTAIVGANVAGAKGSLDGTQQSYTIAANDQITAADAYRDVVVAYRNGAPVFLKRRRRRRSTAWRTPRSAAGTRACRPSSSTSSASPAPT